MLGLVADRGTPYVCMHWRGHSAQMQERAQYQDVVAEVIAELAERLEAIREAGVDLNRVAVDPGIGFAKNADHNWEVLRRLREFAVLERPLLIGASRKAFLGRLLADEETGEPRPAVRRDDASAAVSALAAASGAWCVRAHAVAPSADAVRVARRWGAV
jgi:dihydropteroate synthase